MPDELNNSPEVVISSESALPPPKKRRRKKIRSKAAPKITSGSEPRSDAWFTAISNLALLIAIFTIIFAAHQAFKKNKMPVEADKVRTEAPKAEVAVVEEIKAEPTALKENEIEEIKIEAPKVEQPKIEQPKVVNRTDPYTNGGPLDLDRRDLSAVSVKDAFSDHKNPWNGGGALDLDNSSAREEYKKNYLSANESVK